MAPPVPNARAHDGDVVVLAEAEAGLIEEAGSAFGDPDRLVHVENEAVGFGRHVPHAANDVLDPVHGQEAVQAKVLDPAGVLVQIGAYFRRGLAPGRGRGTGVDPTQGHRRGWPRG